MHRRHARAGVWIGGLDPGTTQDRLLTTNLQGLSRGGDSFAPFAQLNPPLRSALLPKRRHRYRPIAPLSRPIPALPLSRVSWRWLIKKSVRASFVPINHKRPQRSSSPFSPPAIVARNSFLRLATFLLFFLFQRAR